jgi:hypothetical protein
LGLAELVARRGDGEGVPGTGDAAGAADVTGAQDEAGGADGLDDAGADGPADVPDAAEDAPAESAARPGECTANEPTQTTKLSPADPIRLLNADKPPSLRLGRNSGPDGLRHACQP